MYYFFVDCFTWIHLLLVFCRKSFFPKQKIEEKGKHSSTLFRYRKKCLLLIVLFNILWGRRQWSLTLFRSRTKNIFSSSFSSTFSTPSCSHFFFVFQFWRSGYESWGCGGVVVLEGLWMNEVFEFWFKIDIQRNEEIEFREE